MSCVHFAKNLQMYIISSLLLLLSYYAPNVVYTGRVGAFLFTKHESVLHNCTSVKIIVCSCEFSPLIIIIVQNLCTFIQVV